MTILNTRKRGLIIAGLINKAYSGEKTKLTDYVRKVIYAGNVICHKCDFIIEIGTNYHRTVAGPRYSKYYHLKCWYRVLQ